MRPRWTFAPGAALVGGALVLALPSDHEAPHAARCFAISVRTSGDGQAVDKPVCPDSHPDDRTAEAAAIAGLGVAALIGAAVYERRRWPT